VGFTGFGLMAGSSWARWVTIVVASLNVLAQLGFVGNAAYPLWALFALALNLLILYAVTIRWSEGAATLREFGESRY
jgi:hypothetical protein